MGRHIRSLEQRLTEALKGVNRRKKEKSHLPVCFIIEHWHGTENAYPVGVYDNEVDVQEEVDRLNEKLNPGHKHYGYEVSPLNRTET
ncbi:hypothetical protein ACFOHY_17150 [Rhizobium rosettiformans]|uniref:hypothetical protein n=1 Tax=Rhizobium rosettiformans TaxID=1368430 RepID=UPI00360DB953